MKRILIIVAICAVTATSCQKEMDHESKTILTVTADIAQFDFEQGTKTIIDGAAATITPVWSSGDEIKLFDKDGSSAIYVLNSGAGTTKATFSLKSGETALPGIFACAYYPADQALSYADGTGITANFPNTQIYTTNGSGENAGTFAAGSFPMVGVGSLDAEKNNLNLSFKNLFGLLQLNFTSGSFGASIKQINLFSSSSPLSGIATVVPQATEMDTPYCATTFTYAYNYVTLTTSDEALSSTSKAFYIAVPAGSNIDKIGVTSDVDDYSISLSKTIVRSTIKSLTSGDLQTLGFTSGLYYPEAPNKKPQLIAGRIWAPVNCGYHETNYPYGKIYQWGRHYGSGYIATDDISTTEVDESHWNDLGGIIQESFITSPIAAEDEDVNKYYVIVADPCDWLATSNDYRWNSATGENDPSLTTEVAPVKTSNDPCPEGWRAPTYYEVIQLIDTKQGGATEFNLGDGTVKGSYFGPTEENRIFLPASGCRYFDTGDALNRNIVGYYWTSSVTGGSSRYMDIGENFARSAWGSRRARGMAVRCVKE